MIDLSYIFLSILDYSGYIMCDPDIGEIIA